MREKPSGITISTDRGEKINKRLNCRFGFEIQRVTYADHRSGWSGIKLHLYLIWWYFGFGILRWKTRYKPLEATYTLRQQVEDTHSDRWAAYDAAMAARQEEEQEYLRLQHKIVNEGIRRRQAAEEQDEH